MAKECRIDPQMQSQETQLYKERIQWVQGKQNVNNKMRDFQPKVRTGSEMKASNEKAIEIQWKLKSESKNHNDRK